MAEMYIYAALTDKDNKRVIDEDLTFNNEEDAINDLINSLKSADEKVWSKYNDGEDIDIYLYQLDKDHHPCLYKKIEVEKDGDSYKIDEEKSYDLPEDFEPFDSENESDKKDDSKNNSEETSEEDEKEMEEACELVDIFFDLYETGIITEETLSDELLILEEVVGRKSVKEAAEKKKEETAKRKKWLRLHAKKMGGGYLTPEEKEFLYSREWLHAWDYEDKAKRNYDKIKHEYDNQRYEAKQRLKQAKKEKAEREKNEKQMKYNHNAVTESNMINLIHVLEDMEYINESELYDLNSAVTTALFIRNGELNNLSQMKESMSLLYENADIFLNDIYENYMSFNRRENMNESYIANAINMAHEYITEKTLKSKDRNALDESEFGIPSLRKYPIPDKAHVKAAVQRFNFVDKEHEKELANNLIKALKKFNMLNEIKVGKGNRFKTYLDAEFKNFSESYDLKPFPILREFSVGNMLPIMGSTQGWGGELSNTPITDVVASGNADLEKYATLYDTSELINDSELTTESVLPQRNMIFDKEVEKLVRGIKDYLSNPKNDFLEDILKKSINFKKNIYTIRLKDQNGSDSNKIINKIKSCGFKDVDDEGIKAVFEKEVNGLLLTLVYDTVGDKVRITYETMNKGESVITESVDYDKYVEILNERHDEVLKQIKTANIPSGKRAEAKLVLNDNFQKANRFFLKMQENKGLFTKFKRFLDRKGALSRAKIANLFDDYLLLSEEEILNLEMKKAEIEKVNAEAYDARRRSAVQMEAIMTAGSVAKTAIAAKTATELIDESSKDIDDDIQGVVNTLNKKGYKTVASCSGHTKTRIKEDMYRDGIYNAKLYTTARIIFADDFKLNPPKGWKVKNFDGKIGIYPERPNYTYSKGIPDDAFEKWKADYMSELKLWANDLGEKPGPEETKTESMGEFMESIFGESFKDSIGNALKKPKSEKIKDKYQTDFQTNLTFEGVKVRVSHYDMKDKDQLDDETLKELKKNLSTLNSNWRKIFNELIVEFSKKDENDGYYPNSKNVFNRNAKLDGVRYIPFPKQKVNTFELWFNGQKANPNFFGGHSLVVEIDITYDGKVTHRYSIEG